MILTTGQAKAAYDAMCALNNVGGSIAAEMDYVDFLNYKKVAETSKGKIIVVLVVGGATHKDEEFDSQDKFAKAYRVF